MSDKQFQGRYPGGPRRHPDDDVGRSRRGTPLPSVGDLEEQAQERGVQRRRALRRRRIILGLIFVVVAAVGTGFWMGYQTARTQEQLAGENQGPGAQPLSESERRMLEMMRQQNQQPQQPPSNPQSSPRPD